MNGRLCFELGRVHANACIAQNDSTVDLVLYFFFKKNVNVMIRYEWVVNLLKRSFL